MNKKTLFAIATFIVAGFFMYTFANPLNDNNSQAQENGNTVTPVDNNGTNNNQNQNNNEQENVDNNNNNQQNNNQNNQQNQNNNNNAVANNNNQGNAQNNENQQNNVNNELADAIAKAKEELSNYKKDVDLNEEYQKKYDDTKEDGIKSLDDAKSIDEVNGSLAESKGKIDTIIADDLSAYKKAAKENILAYANELKVLDITTLIIDDANTLIDDATTKSAIDTIVNDTKTKLDEVLNAKKKEALEELENYTEYVFSENNLEKFNNIVDTTIKNITDAADLDSVNKALKDGEELIDTLISNDFEEFRSEKIDYLTHYKENVKYSEENANLVNGYRTNGIDAIKAVNTFDKVSVTEALNNALDLIDAVQTLANTTFAVTFIGFDGKAIGEVQNVLYEQSATAPDMETTINVNNLVYTFKGWDNEFSSITSDTVINAKYELSKAYATIYVRDYETYTYGKLNTVVELDLNRNRIKNAISNNITTNINLYFGETVQTLVIDKLPEEALNINYSYIYNSLNFEKDKGFRIEAVRVFDQEKFAKNTVKITYKINGPVGTFIYGKKVIEAVEYDGSINTKLPQIYVGRILLDTSKYNVVWKEANGNAVKDAYTSSVELVANISLKDTTAPEIKLVGDKEVTVIKGKTFDYNDYSASDNIDGNITDKVIVTIKKDNTVVNTIDWNHAGTYKITYTVSDKALNSTSLERTITIIEKVGIVIDGNSETNRAKYMIGGLMKELKVYYLYSDGSKGEQQLKASDYAITGVFDSSKLGDNEIVITVKNNKFTATYYYNVDKEQPTITIGFSKNGNGHSYGNRRYYMLFSMPNGAEIIGKPKFVSTNSNSELQEFKYENGKYYISYNDYNDLVIWKKQLQVSYKIADEDYTTLYRIN